MSIHKFTKLAKSNTFLLILALWQWNEKKEKEQLLPIKPSAFPWGVAWSLISFHDGNWNASLIIELVVSST